MDESIVSTSSPQEDIGGASRIALLLRQLGNKLGFDVFCEVEASEAAWVDIVWCDRRFSRATLPAKKPKLRRAPVLPVVAFEVENKTGLNPKHVKGSVSNLNNCGAQMGVIVIGNESFALLGKQPAHSKKKPAVLESELLERAYRWVHAEAQPKGRIVLMSERELFEWAAREGVKLEARHRCASRFLWLPVPNVLRKGWLLAGPTAINHNSERHCRALHLRASSGGILIARQVAEHSGRTRQFRSRSDPWASSTRLLAVHSEIFS